MFYFLLALFSTTCVWFARARGAQAALHFTLAAVLALPVWVYRDFGGIRLDIRMAAGMVGLIVCVLDPREKLVGRFLLADLLVLALALSNVASEALTSDITATVVLNILMQWLVPYALGRRLTLDEDGLRRAVPWLAGGAALLALFAVVESVTRVNFAQLLAGNEGSLQGNQDIRWGLKRAEGTLTHPIFFGTLLVLTLPWTIESARWARQQLAPRWWSYLPWVTAAGTFFTMSRGPQLSVLGSLAVIAGLRSRAWRPVVLLVVLGTAGLAYTQRDEIVAGLHAWSGEGYRDQIDIRGEYYEYSGTTHRLLQFLVFEEAMEHAGWFGYGGTPLMAGENRLPFVEDHLRKRFSSIDNHYIEFLLRTGYLGLGLFAALGATALAYLIPVAMQRSSDEGLFAATLAGTHLAITISLLAVWFAPDFGFVWLLNVALAAGLRSAALNRGAAFDARRLAITLPRRLFPGHPACGLAT